MSTHREARSALSWHPLLFLLAAYAFPRPAIAGSIRVPTDTPNIQLAIDESAPGDTVLVEAGTYAGPGNRNLNFRGKDLVLLGIEGAAATIIDCEGSEAEPARGFIFEGGEPGTAVVAGFTIRNGYRRSTGWPDDSGAAILIRNTRTRPTIRQCHFENNHSSRTGGGIAIADNAAPTITACRFVGNTAWTGGGGLLVNRANAVIVECEFIDNRSRQGDGGAFMSSGPNSAIFRDCRFLGNSALNGGAIMLEHSNPAIVAQCSFTDNAAALAGGAIHIAGGAALTVSRSVFAGNEATLRAGAVCCGEGAVDLVACTLFGNASTSGTGLSVIDNGVVTAAGTIIAFGRRGEAIACTGTGTATLRCCNLFGNENGDWTGHVAPQESMDGNMAADPLFCNVGAGDFHLAETSPCAPPRSGSCGVIGSFGVACVSTVEETTWGSIKASYRR